MVPGVSLESNPNGLVNEPPLQHKKRIDGPPSSWSTDFVSKPSAGPEYLLLGQQEKFANNVKYQTRTHPSDTVYKNQENWDSVPSSLQPVQTQARTKPQLVQRSLAREPQLPSQADHTPTSPPPAPRAQETYGEQPKALKDKDLSDVLQPSVTKSKEQKEAASKQVTQKQAVTDTQTWKHAVESSNQNSQQVDHENRNNNQSMHAGNRNTNQSMHAGNRNNNQSMHAGNRNNNQSMHARNRNNNARRSRSPHQETKRVGDSRNILEGKGGWRSEQQGQRRRHKKPEKEASSHMNEFVQTNLRKGVALSGPEAPDDYSLKYKAGVAPPRSSAKVSEYKKQFQWKDNIDNSPLLTAEEVVFKSTADLGPYKRDGIPRVSEYQRAYRSPSPGPSVAQSRVSLNHNNNNNSNINNYSSNNENNQKKVAVVIEHKKKPEAKRSKSAGAVPQTENIDESRKNKQTADIHARELKSKLMRSHGKLRRFGLGSSEYQSKYRSPTSYKYQHGVWDGPFSTQPMSQAGTSLMDKNNNFSSNNNRSNNNIRNKDEMSRSSWFEEVIELRQRAEENRRRAQGTHFSCQNMMVSEQNECWDADSEASSTLEALNLESPVTRNESYKTPVAWDSESPEAATEGDSTSTAGDSAATSEEEDGHSATKDKSNNTTNKIKRGPLKVKKGGQLGRDRVSRKMAWLEEHRRSIERQKRRLEREQQILEQSSPDEDEDDEKDTQKKLEGRLPTPVLRQSVSPVRRHHLDRTTPCVGGALLTSPSFRSNQLLVTDRTGRSHMTASDEKFMKPSKQTYKVDHFHTTPVYGKPSGESHMRRKKRTGPSHHKQAAMMESLEANREDDKENVEARVKPRVKRSLGDLTAVPEGYGRTYHINRPYLNLDDLKRDEAAVNQEDDDDDALSVSLISIESSSSLASEVLERTKKRRDFWTRKTTGTR